MLRAESCGLCFVCVLYCGGGTLLGGENFRLPPWCECKLTTKDYVEMLISFDHLIVRAQYVCDSCDRYFYARCCGGDTVHTNIGGSSNPRTVAQPEWERMILIEKSRAIHMHMMRQNRFSNVYINARYLSYPTLLAVRPNTGLWIHTMKS